TAGGVRLYTPSATASWEAAAAAELRAAWAGKPPIERPVHLLVRAVARRPKRLMRQRDSAGRLWRGVRPDADNVLKAVADAMQLAGVVRDDALIVRVEAESLYTAKHESPRVEIVLREVESEPR
ncbi:MAG TPA: RusA family crossover junction endodeoxyribonuclease, partial [Thermoleophilia bacterium]|nr:RusA family crossover junction endodeoxyribonuclease [Thermoleophilia bacterium]